MTCFQCGKPTSTPIGFTETNATACPDCVIGAARAGVLPAQAQARLTGAALIALINRAAQAAQAAPAPSRTTPAHPSRTGASRAAPSKPSNAAKSGACRRCGKPVKPQFGLCFDCYQAQPDCPNCGQAKCGFNDAAQDWYPTCYECSSGYRAA